MPTGGPYQAQRIQRTAYSEICWQEAWFPVVEATSNTTLLSLQSVHQNSEIKRTEPQRNWDFKKGINFRGRFIAKDIPETLWEESHIDRTKKQISGHNMSEDSFYHTSKHIQNILMAADNSRHCTRPYTFRNPRWLVSRKREWFIADKLKVIYPVRSTECNKSTQFSPGMRFFKNKPTPKTWPGFFDYHPERCGETHTISGWSPDSKLGDQKILDVHLCYLAFQISQSINQVVRWSVNQPGDKVKWVACAVWWGTNKISSAKNINLDAIAPKPEPKSARLRIVKSETDPWNCKSAKLDRPNISGHISCQWTSKPTWLQNGAASSMFSGKLDLRIRG